MPQIEIATMSAIQVNLKEIAKQLTIANKLKAFEIEYSNDYGLLGPNATKLFNELSDSIS